MRKSNWIMNPHKSGVNINKICELPPASCTVISCAFQARPDHSIWHRLVVQLATSPVESARIFSRFFFGKIRYLGKVLGMDSIFFRTKILQKNTYYGLFLRIETYDHASKGKPLDHGFLQKKSCSCSVNVHLMSLILSLHFSGALCGLKKFPIANVAQTKPVRHWSLSSQFISPMVQVFEISSISTILSKPPK